MSESFQRQSQKNFKFCSHKNCTLTMVKHSASTHFHLFPTDNDTAQYISKAFTTSNQYWWQMTQADVKKALEATQTRQEVKGLVSGDWGVTHSRHTTPAQTHSKGKL